MNNYIDTIYLEQMAKNFDFREATEYTTDPVIRDRGEAFRALISNIDGDGNRLKTLKDEFGKMNFSHWTNGDNMPKRETAIKLCFALNLKLDDVKLFLEPPPVLLNFYITIYICFEMLYNGA